MIEFFLLGEGIILLRKYGGAGEYLKITWGMSRLGVDLYVSWRKQMRLSIQCLSQKKRLMTIRMRSRLRILRGLAGIRVGVRAESDY